jgi:SAM-dependent methyltransferase
MAAGILFFIAGVALYLSIATSDLELARVFLIAGPFVGTLMIVLAESLLVGSRTGKINEIRKLVQDIPWGGEELVLDLGCGRGPLTAFAAKRLTKGEVVGLDLWNPRHVSGNSPYSLMANAEVDKVEERVAPVRGTSTSLPFPEGTFDVIVSGLGLGHIGGWKNVEKVAGEMVSALREGGRISILVSGRSEGYSEALSKLGMKEVAVARYRLGLFPPVQRVTGRKPYAGRVPDLG